MKTKNQTNERAKEFLECLGNGKDIYTLEAKNDQILGDQNE